MLHCALSQLRNHSPLWNGCFIVYHCVLEVCDLFLTTTGLTAEGLPESQKRLCTLLFFFFLETIKVHGDSWKGNGCILHCEMTMNPWGHRVEGYDLKEVSLAAKLTRAGLVMIKIVNLI